ncbi:hypothetical protein K439DRAFT_1617503 [Ramaria rubella]|nr:hypothetical protein K439DRAFT_1617503 [Ramaria rubella]
MASHSWSLLPPPSVIEISSGEEIVVEMEEMDWKKKQLEEKLWKKVKVKQEKQERELAEKQERDQKQKEEDDQKRKEKEDKDQQKQEELSWSSGFLTARALASKFPTFEAGS